MIRPRGKSYIVDVSVNGQRRRVTCKTYAEAEAAQKQMETAAESVTVLHQAVRGNWSIGYTFQMVRDTVWLGKAGGPDAVRNAQAAVDFFGEKTPLTEIATDWIDAYIARLKQIGNSNGTVNRKLAALSKLFTYAQKRHTVSGLIVRPHFERQEEFEGRIRFLTNEEESVGLRYLEQWGKDDHAEVLCCLIDSGLRPSELWKLEARDCDFKNGIMSIWDTKNGKARSVPMTTRVKEIMERRSKFAGKGSMFPFDNDWFGQVWDRMKHAMGLGNDDQFVPYALRHTCASRLAQRGVDFRTIQDWMGHKTPKITMRYTHLCPKNMLEAVKVLERC